MLEFLIWYRRGWKGVLDFQNDRIKEDNCEIPEDVFFNATNKDPAGRSVQLKRSVATVSPQWRTVEYGCPISESDSLLDFRIPSR
jgi:hypothetical protein